MLTIPTEPIGSITPPSGAHRGGGERRRRRSGARAETPEEVCERVLEAAESIPVAQLGTTDDCGFSPFSDDTSTTRDTAFAKIRARVDGTRLAADRLGSR